MASEGSDPHPPPQNATLVQIDPSDVSIPGLEPLLPLNQIFVKQGTDILEGR